MQHFYQNLEGWFDFDDIYSRMVNGCKEPAHFVEVGSWKGKSTAYMAVEIANSHKDIRFDCIDTWEGSEENFQDMDVINRSLYQRFLTNLKPADGYYIPRRMSSLLAAPSYKDKSLDFVFIDAAHDYENVKADIEAWLPKVKIGGYIGGHDYPYPDVMRAVDEKFTNAFYSRQSWLIQVI